MTTADDAWLQTNTRVAYIVVKLGVLPETITYGQALVALTTRFRRVYGISNTTTFAMNHEGTACSAIRRSGEIAIIILIPETVGCSSGDLQFQKLEAQIAAYVSEIRNTLGIGKDQRGLTVQSWALEVSRLRA